MAYFICYILRMIMWVWIPYKKHSHDSRNWYVVVVGKCWYMHSSKNTCQTWFFFKICILVSIFRKNGDKSELPTYKIYVSKVLCPHCGLGAHDWIFCRNWLRNLHPLCHFLVKLYIKAAISCDKFLFELIL